MPRRPRWKPWSLQVDGDLWQILWTAIIPRGSKAQTFVKVKAHAKQIDIDEGRASEDSKRGNDNADSAAIRAIRNRRPGLSDLLQWLARRHEAYCKFVWRVQCHISKVSQDYKSRCAQQDTFNRRVGYNHKGYNGIARALQHAPAVMPTAENEGGLGDLPDPRGKVVGGCGELPDPAVSDGGVRDGSSNQAQDEGGEVVARAQYEGEARTVKQETFLITRNQWESTRTETTLHTLPYYTSSYNI